MSIKYNQYKRYTLGLNLRCHMMSMYDGIKLIVIPGISVTAPIRRSTPWAFIWKNFPFVPTIEMSTLLSLPSKTQINAQGAVTENPGMPNYEIYCMNKVIHGVLIKTKLALIRTGRLKILFQICVVCHLCQNVMDRVYAIVPTPK